MSPVFLTDRQLEHVMATAGQLEIEKRDTFLQRLAAALHMHGIRKPADADVELAARSALRGLMQGSAGAA